MIEKYKRMLELIYEYRDKDTIDETEFEISVYGLKEKIEAYFEMYKTIGLGKYLKNKILKENSEKVKTKRMSQGQKTILNGSLKRVTTSINSLFLEIKLYFNTSSDLTKITIFKDIDSDEFNSEVIVIKNKDESNVEIGNLKEFDFETIITKNNGEYNIEIGSLEELDPLFLKMYYEDIVNIFRVLEEKNDLLENNLDDGIFDDITFTDGFINGRMQINRKGKVEVFLENFVSKNSSFVTLQELKDINTVINYIEGYWDLFLKKVPIDKLKLPFSIQRIVEEDFRKSKKVKKKQLSN